MTLLGECHWLITWHPFGWADDGVTSTSHLNGLSRISMQGPGQAHQGIGVREPHGFVLNVAVKVLLWPSSGITSLS